MRILVLLSFLFGVPAIACNSDYDCGYGKHCVKSEKDYSLQGTCVVPVNEYGQKDYDADRTWGNSYGPKDAESCQFNTDCPIGYNCMKRAGSIYGICMK